MVLRNGRRREREFWLGEEDVDGEREDMKKKKKKKKKKKREEESLIPV